MNDQPEPISRAEQRARIRRITDIANKLRFTGARSVAETAMMGKKKLSEIKVQIESLSAEPSGKPPKAVDATSEPKQIVETLEALCAELERVAKKPRKPRTQRSAKR